MRLWRALRSSAAARSLSCVAGPGFRASPKRTPTEATVSETVQRSERTRGLAKIMRDSGYELEAAGDGEMNGGRAHGTTCRKTKRSCVLTVVTWRWREVFD